MVKAVPDDLERIVAEIKAVMELYPLVLTTGGLGPTFDDLTMEAVAKACGTELKMNEFAFSHIQKRLEGLGVSLWEGHHRQAHLPATANIIPNDRGTACGTIMQYNGSMIISLPGVPFEMYPMITDSVIPYMIDYFEPEIPYMEDLHFANVPESDVDKLIIEHGIPEGVKCIINASIGEVIVRLRSVDEAAKGLATYLKEKLAPFYVYSGTETPANLTVKLLLEKGKTVSAAESCTGGLLSSMFTAIPGSSGCFLGSVVSYANEVKMKLLNVSENTLNTKGAVSEECAREMLAGIKALMDTDFALAVTGIAGPGGGSDEKPVGTVYIGISSGENIKVTRFKFGGDRNTIQQRSAKAAIFMLLSELKAL
jgi:nicotinamide-nucleotide amidase